MIISFLVFILSYISLKNKVALFQIGLDYNTLDIIVMGLSLISIIYSLYEIFKVEHAKQYEEKLGKLVMEKKTL